MDQSGSKWFKKRGTPLDFKTFYSLLRNHINDGHDASTFVKELIAMITDVSEEEWGTKKDPSGSVSPVTYRNFSKRGISKRV
ncbi:HNH endonuclease, partial [Bifidobacteriaceae bacterium WP021]